MLAHLPILQVMVPLAAAPVCLILRKPWLEWLLSLAVSGVAFVISALLLADVVQHGTLTYELGGWAAPWGIEYRIDQLNAYVLLIVTTISTIVLLSAHTSVQSEVAEERRRFFYVAFLLCLSGLLGIVATGDLFNVFVFLEMSALSSYILIALGHDRRGLWAAFQYLVMGTVGATFILVGIGLMYAMTGTLNMHDMSERMVAVSDSRTVLTAFVFLVVGVCLKLALFPVHLWLPNAYASAPSAVTAFLAATATKVAVYLLIRITFSIFGVDFSFSSFPLQYIFLVLSLAGVFIASITAIFQENVKRLLAYSSIAQVGYMILGFSLANESGLTASLLHLFNHALMKGALFLALGAVMYRLGSVRLADMAGIGTAMPWTMGAVVIGGLSLIGVPLTVGFISKWYLITAALERDWWGVAILVLFGSLLALIYIWRVVETAYFKQASSDMLQVKEAPASLLIPTWILVAANVYFGIDTRLTIGISESIASMLFGAAS